jgi:hypothetical protein
MSNDKVAATFGRDDMDKKVWQERKEELEVRQASLLKALARVEAELRVHNRRAEPW